MGTSTSHEIDGSDYSPTELSAAVLKELKKQTEERIGPITESVVTIPANFSNEARDATMEAAKMATLRHRTLTMANRFAGTRSTICLITYSLVTNSTLL
mgnify:CR=1 FL=1